MGSRPVGPITVDRSNVYGRNLRYGFFPTLLGRDLLHGLLTVGGTGPVVYGAGEAEFNDSVYLDYGLTTPAQTEFTVVFRYKRKGTGQREGIFSEMGATSWGSKGFHIELGGGANDVDWYINNKLTRIDDTSIPYDQWRTVVCTWKAGVFQEIYIDGESYTYTQNNIAAAHTQSTDSLVLGGFYNMSSTYALRSFVEFIYAFDGSVTQAEARALVADPYQVIRPDTALDWFPWPASGGGAQTIALGLAAGSESAQLLGIHKQAAANQAVEVGSGLSVAPAHAATVGQAVDLGTALSLIAGGAIGLGLAMETSAAPTVAAIKTALVGQAVSGDTAQAIAALINRVVSVARATETATAFPVGASSPGVIGQAVETDSALLLVIPTVQTVNTAGDANQAQPVRPALHLPVGLAPEAVAALQALVAKSAAVGQAVEIDGALAITVEGALVIVADGLQWAMVENRLHYAFGDGRIHYTLH